MPVHTQHIAVTQKTCTLTAWWWKRTAQNPTTPWRCRWIAPNARVYAHPPYPHYHQHCHRRPQQQLTQQWSRSQKHFPEKRMVVGWRWHPYCRCAPTVWLLRLWHVAHKCNNGLILTINKGACGRPEKWKKTNNNNNNNNKNNKTNNNKNNKNKNNKNNNNKNNNNKKNKS